MRLIQLATATLVAFAIAGPALAAATYDSGNKQPTPVARGEGSGGSAGTYFQPQCYPTGTAYVMRCTKPRVPKVNAAEEDCSCAEVKVRVKGGGYVWKSDCTKTRPIDVKLPRHKCGDVRTLSRAGG